MGLLHKIIRRRQETITSAAKTDAITVSVPDIKQYLVNEMERNRDLSLEIEGLRQKAEEQTELQNKYNAALVALDEYKRRVDALERNLKRESEARSRGFEERRQIESERNTYKIKCEQMERGEAERLQAARRDERTKLIEAIVAGIENSKGNLSKDRVRFLVQRFADVEMSEKGGTDNDKN